MRTSAWAAHGLWMAEQLAAGRDSADPPGPDPVTGAAAFPGGVTDSFGGLLGDPEEIPAGSAGPSRRRSGPAAGRAPGGGAESELYRAWGRGWT